MKKFIKYGAIAGCVMILAGTGIATASFAMGASPRRISEFIEERFDDCDTESAVYGSEENLSIT